MIKPTVTAVLGAVMLIMLPACGSDPSDQAAKSTPKVTAFEELASGDDWGSLAFAGDQLWVGAENGIPRLDP